MRKGLVLAFGAAIVAGAMISAPVTATAMTVNAGVSQMELATSPLIEQVQMRRRVGGPVRGPVRGGGRRGGIGAAGAAAIGLGILGVAAAAAAANQRPAEYYEPAPVYGGPVCHFERQPVYDRFGNYRGDRRVRVCD